MGRGRIKEQYSRTVLQTTVIKEYDTLLDLILDAYEGFEEIPVTILDCSVSGIEEYWVKYTKTKEVRDKK